MEGLYLLFDPDIYNVSYRQVTQCWGFQTGWNFKIFWNHFLENKIIKMNLETQNGDIDTQSTTKHIPQWRDCK